MRPRWELIKDERSEAFINSHLGRRHYYHRIMDRPVVIIVIISVAKQKNTHKIAMIHLSFSDHIVIQLIISRVERCLIVHTCHLYLSNNSKDQNVTNSSKINLKHIHILPLDFDRLNDSYSNEKVSKTNNLAVRCTQAHITM